jgi:hypothetical protein
MFPNATFQVVLAALCGACIAAAPIVVYLVSAPALGR